VGVNARLPPPFDAVELPSFRPSAASPELEGAGLLLAAPERVELGTSALPIACSYAFGAPFINRFFNVEAQLTLVVVDCATHDAWSRANIQGAWHIHEMRVDVSNPEWQEEVHGGWFNVDLFVVAPELPRATKRVLAYAFVGDLVSNVVDIRIGSGA
jgi:hypothetical protein